MSAPGGEPIASALAAQPAPARVVRVVGAGARRAAAAWASRSGALPRVVVGQLPAPGAERLWLDGVPGARSVADAWVAWSVLTGQPCELVLTGAARDGGHPSVGASLQVEGLDGADGVDPAQVELPAGAASLADAADQGDLALALARYEQIAIDDPLAAAPWCWLELARLRVGGRGDEVAERALALPGRHRCHAAVLLEMAAAASAMRSERHAARLAAAALDAGADARVATDAAYELAFASGGRGDRPATTWWFAARLRVLGAADPASRHELDALPGPYARAAAAEVEGSGDAAAYVRAGHARDAARLLAESEARHEAAARYADQGAERLLLKRVVAALDGGEVEQAEALLAPLRERLRDTNGTVAMAVTALTGRLAALRGDAVEVHWAAHRLAHHHERLGPAVPLPLAAPAGPEAGDPWCVAAWLRALHAVYSQHDAWVRARVAALPRRPVALGPYALERPIASGGMGTVWRATHRIAAQQVAIKLLDDVAPERVALFRREIEVVARFEHPAIVAVLDIVEVDALAEAQSGGAVQRGQPGLVMELVDGGSLADHVGALPWDELRDVLLALLDALAYAHAHGVVHRDLKPANVLLTAAGQLRLTDFGVSAVAQGRVAGTPAYMAPEQFAGGRVGPEADVYALGCVGWALATGAPPWFGSLEVLARAHREAEPPRFRPELPMPVELEVWLRRCLAKQAGRRFRSAAAAADALAAIQPSGWVEGAGGPPPRAGQAEPTFALGTLLDLPASPAGGEPTTALGGLHDVFEERPTARPLLPTPVMLRYGDPPVLFQRAAQHALWAALMQAVAGRRVGVALVGPGGHGKRSLLRWLRRRAHMAGLRPDDHPVPGRLGIVDVTDLPPEARPSGDGQPWLLIDRARVPAGFRVVRVERVGAAGAWWIVHSRILLTPRLAAQAAVQAVGTPGLALTLVEDWLVEPGMRGSPEGLSLVREPPVATPGAVAWWRRQVARWSEPRRRLSALVALQPAALAQRTLERLAPRLGVDSGDARGVALRINGSLRVPGAAAAALDERLTPDERASLHLLLAEHLDSPLDAAYHRAEADPSESSAYALADVMARRPLHISREHLVEAAARALDRHLLDHPAARDMVFVGRASEVELQQLARRTDRVGDLAVARVAYSVLRLSEAQADGLDARIARTPDLLLAANLGWIRAAYHTFKGRYARADQGLREVRAVVERAGLADPHPLAILDWSRIRSGLRDTDPATLTSWIEALGDPMVRRAASVDVADAWMRVGGFGEALALLERGQGSWLIEADYNRVVCFLGLDRPDDALRLIRRVAPVALAEGRRSLFAGLLVGALVLDEAMEAPMWSRLAGLAGPVADPQLRGLLAARVAQLAPGRRRERLEGWVRG